jgi:hypothetical protein
MKELNLKYWILQDPPYDHSKYVYYGYMNGKLCRILPEIVDRLYVDKFNELNMLFNRGGFSDLLTAEKEEDK